MMQFTLKNSDFISFEKSLKTLRIERPEFGSFSKVNT